MLAKWEPKGFQQALYATGAEWADYTTNAGVTYHIKLIARKILKIRIGEGKGSRQTWTHYDVWGYFQGSFEKALDDWHIGTTGLIHEGKQRRGAFTRADFDDGFAERYNAEECQKLVALMNALNAKLEAVDLVPSSWHGAGSIASRLLADSRCRKRFKPNIKALKDLDRWQRFAYFGGRVELVQRGERKQVYSYDVNSAYPHSTLSMPDISGGWESVPGSALAADDFALVEVWWDFPDSRIGPLPFRLASGYVVFPSHGHGIYHNVEVQAALAFKQRWEAGRQWQIKLGRALRLKRPYSYPLHDYVDKQAKKRLAYKKAKDFAHIPIKLGLNALYGKFAQRPQKVGQKPIYRQLLVAGYVTAHCRAALLSAVNPETVILFATDSIKSSTPLDLPVGEDLGQWEPEVWPDALFILAGVYGYEDDAGVWHNKTRGLHELDIKAVYAASQRGSTFAAIDRQFMGVKRCLANWKAYPEPCRFYPLKKEIDWNSNSKRDHWDTDGKSVPMSEFEETMSTMYTTKCDDVIEESDE
jgi:hypothetical protein